MTVQAELLSDEEKRKIEELVEQEEGGIHKFVGWWGKVLTFIAFTMTIFHLYAAASTVDTQSLREIHVAYALSLVFLLFPAVKSWRNRVAPWDIVAAGLVIVCIWYMMTGGSWTSFADSDDFLDRYVSPTQTDLVIGGILILLVLESTRRATGWIMPILSATFLAYAMWGNYLPAPWTHKGYPLSDLIAEEYMTLNGIFGSAIDVSATLIILFTIFGAILQASGAGRFFIDFSLRAMKGQPNAAGRAVVLSSFLLGGPSGSGVATTVTIGTVAWPIMKEAGYGKSAAGGLLAAGGLGAILSPPVLGAAAFLIAEYLKMSYLDIVRMALIPTCLYYFGLLMMTEIDSRKYGLRAVDPSVDLTMKQLMTRYGFHFTSLISVVVLMVWGFSATYAVFWSILLAIMVSYLRADTALWPDRLFRALADGSIQALGVAATCACAGLIVGVITKTGLALKFSSIVIDLAGGSVFWTAMYTALIVWVVGLAVPVTASYIMCAVIAAPALIKLGIPDYAAHMFIFYYAVLSEVSPPTALAPFAAATITRADPYVTTLQSWKYALPAFLVPFIFVLDPIGTGLLLETPKNMSWLWIPWVTLGAAGGIVALAVAAQGHLWRPLGIGTRVVCGVAGIALTFPGIVDDWVGGMVAARAIGLAILVAVLLYEYRSPRPHHAA
ncbi:TRAP transporter fused permease subunit [Reyranella sp.]|jgi:TRAP transporter 4TM/12TM fusion protein|uniref:TRAP transporter permease n=1 Tax=Reyranella sp. TaxID=1929291 RepID=UPI000BDABEBF|nr:TRAP transporter fused permease subunit [Reyranella sp.]OYY41258.1 MAG: C4-dicarboxylate ABC transporter permease [Rhodospirillales bacterium 35-66-84]OYZ93456.1 MAG: C4-dicarboxylate ABC transporter permease [Rhodospirillales bacterium 24-66-33]OZB21849.1 MAG: C4-dicarboxylate ABC transporter permease [Rhodospirillales bacterium 39-66-50]HQS16381.1 TRAP transporter fused permease subunit [Reyranella sp.]HQT12212.1 TRAP transporter fused permease subunit [Reyranella sp.]